MYIICKTREQIIGKQNKNEEISRLQNIANET